MGDREHLRALFGKDVELESPERAFHFRFACAESHADYFVTDYPPIAAAIDKLGEDERASLRSDIVDLAERFDVSSGAGVVLPLDYLEVLVTKP